MTERKASLLVCIVAFNWGLGFAVTKQALSSIEPITFITLRFALGTLVLAFFARKFTFPTTLKLKAFGLLSGFLLGVGYVLQTIGLQSTTSGKAAFITGLSVVLIPLLSIVLLRERIRSVVLAGVFLAALGLGFLSLDEGLQFLSGDLWVIGCAILFAFHLIVTTYFLRFGDPGALAFIQVAISTLVACAAAVMFEHPSLANIFGHSWSLAFTGILGTAFTFYLLMQAQKYISATRTGLILVLEPVFGALFGWLWLGEVLTARELFGCGLILGAIVIVVLNSSIPKTPSK